MTNIYDAQNNVNFEYSWLVAHQFMEWSTTDLYILALPKHFTIISSRCVLKETEER